MSRLQTPVPKGVQVQLLSGILMISWSDIVSMSENGSFDPSDVDEKTYVHKHLIRLNTTHSYVNGEIIELFLGYYSSDRVILNDLDKTINKILNRFSTVEIDDGNIAPTIFNIRKKYGVNRQGNTLMIEISSLEHLKSAIKDLTKACQEIYEFVYDREGFERAKV